MSGVEKVATGIVAGLFGLAIANIFLSKKSNTPKVLQSAGGALSGSLLAAQGQRA